VRNGSNKEVWRDERTKLLWSSRVITAVNWCRASGNTQMAPVTYRNAYNNTIGNPTVGNGTISNIIGGSSSEDGVITITFTDAENFTVTGANCDGGSPLTLGAAQGSQSNY